MMMFPAHNIPTEMPAELGPAAFYRLFDFVPIPMIIAEEVIADGKVRSIHRHYNRKFLDMIGYTLEEVPDMETWYQTAYPDAAYRAQVIADFDRTVQECITRGDYTTTNLSKVRCKDGHERWFEIIGELRSAIRENWHVVALLEVTRLKVMMAELDELARTDALTHLLNRRGLIEQLEREHSRSQRTGNSFCIVLGDLDNFKQINDSYGHDCGDYVLSTVATVLRTTLRENDLAARWGGEEFCLLLPETGLVGARTVVDRIKANLSTINMSYGPISLAPTLTFGIAEHLRGSSLNITLQQADVALYQGKMQGKNKIVMYTSNVIE
jgi:diguanylate cyclase (GGDEF)-like protein/PAS domain S-box-containing protein